MVSDCVPPGAYKLPIEREFLKTYPPEYDPDIAVPASYSLARPVNVSEVVLAILLTTPTNKGVVSVVQISSPTATLPTEPKLEPVPVTVALDDDADIVPAPAD